MFAKPTYEQLEQRIKELERSEALFRGLFDTMPNGSAIYEVINEGKNGADYILKNINKKCIELEDTPQEQVRDKSLSDFRPTLEASCMRPVFRKVWETGETACFPVTLSLENNISRYFEHYIFKLPTGEVVALYNEVTEHKHTAITIQKTKERLYFALKFANNGLFDWNLETNEMYYSPVWKSLLGYTDHEVKNEFSEWERLTKAEDRQASLAMLKELLAGKRDHFKNEFKMAHKDGHWVDILSRANLIYNEDGKPIRVIGTHVDITERKDAEKALAQSESRYRTLFDFNPIQTVVVNNNGQIVMFNFAKKKSAGRLPTLGTVMYKDYAQKHHIDMHAELMECLKDRKKRAYSEIKYNDRYLNIQIAPYSGGAIITSEDATEKIQLQTLLEQTRKMETVGTLSGGIAHEFNNVLGIIMGNTELAMDDVSQWDPAYDFLVEIKKASVRGKKIVRQLLSFSHKSNWEQKQLNIADLVRESIQFLRATIPSTITFDLKIASACNTILGDKTQIHQLMINLCGNAAQAMEESGGTIKITLQQKHVPTECFFAGQCLNPGHYVLLTIADTGTGIAPGIIESVFDPFFTTKTMDKGTGLGLAVVYGVVNRHGGFVEIESEPTIGTKVMCYFPFTKEVLDTKHKLSTTLPIGNETILFVDDEAVIVKMGKLQLERLGYQVEPYTNPYDALKSFQSNPNKYDLVITDMTMPQMAGDQLIKTLKGIRNDVKTIICTGYSKRVNEEAALAMGANGYIMKPFDREKLSTIIRKILDNNLLQPL